MTLIRNRKLGALVSVVQREMERAVTFRDDPITRMSGVGDELQPLVNRATMLAVEVELRRAGYHSYREFLVEVVERTCDHWVDFKSWLGHYDDMTGVGFFSGDAYEPDLGDLAAFEKMEP